MHAFGEKMARVALPENAQTTEQNRYPEHLWGDSEGVFRESTDAQTAWGCVYRPVQEKSRQLIVIGRQVTNGY